MSFVAVFVFPILIIVILLSTIGGKLLSSYLLFHNLLGKRQSFLLGLGLSVRFSTAFIVQYILFASGLITLGLYSALVGTAVLVTPLIMISLP